jgi:hypothetical protein
VKRLATRRRVLLRADPSQDTFDRYERLLAYANLRRGPDLALSPAALGLGARVRVRRRAVPARAGVPARAALGPEGGEGGVGQLRRRLSPATLRAQATRQLNRFSRRRRVASRSVV